MSRAALRGIVAIAAIWSVSAVVQAVDPHVDPGMVPGSCNACHRGHGAPGSPMLPTAQAGVCLSCHGSRAAAETMVLKGMLAAAARPQSLSTVLAQPFGHPIDDRAFFGDEFGSVTCSSCHSPHRGSGETRETNELIGTPRRSQRNPMQTEFELCGSCHGGAGPAAGASISRGVSLSPANRSYHPVQAPANESSPSVRSSLAGREINCTDCHGNGDPKGPRGPHGSPIRHILNATYTGVDGHEESEATYALCYRCHDRAKVLDSPLFPQHRLHVVKARASCATCHSAHGSVENRALIRLGDDYQAASLAASTRSGMLGYESALPGVGECYVTCHGYDHAPAVYGDATRVIDSGLMSTEGSPSILLPESRPGRPRGPAPRETSGRRTPRKE